MVSMDWTDNFGDLTDLPSDLRRTLIDQASIVRLPSGTTIFTPGQPADNFLLLAQGAVRVFQQSETGREIFLYRVDAGETCILTTACMIAGEQYSAQGVTETDIEAILISKQAFDNLLTESLDFRMMIFGTHSRRITTLFRLIDDIVFRRLDQRLAGRLLDLAGADDVARTTHHMLAVDLGTAREVVTRTLAEFQRRGWIEQSRGEVRVISVEGLRRIAA